MHKVKIETTYFDGAYDPQGFSDWLSDIDYFFEWYNMFEKCKVRFARMQLKESAKNFRTSVERDRER